MGAVRGRRGVIDERRVLYRRFADPLYDPNWHPDDQPRWPGLTPSEAFQGWIVQRLAELDEKVRALRTADIEAEFVATDYAVQRALIAHLSPGAPSMSRLIGRVDAAKYQLSRKGRKPSFDEVQDFLTRQDDPAGKRRGPTKDSAKALRTRRADADGAWEIWKVRRVLCPRFWPGDAVGEFKLAKGTTGAIAASRGSCTPVQAERHYAENGLANL